MLLSSMWKVGLPESSCPTGSALHDQLEPSISTVKRYPYLEEARFGSATEGPTIFVSYSSRMLANLLCWLLYKSCADLIVHMTCFTELSLDSSSFFIMKCARRKHSESTAASMIMPSMCEKYSFFTACIVSQSPPKINPAVMSRRIWVRQIFVQLPVTTARARASFL